MIPGIREIVLHDQYLSPVRAEVHATVVPDGARLLTLEGGRLNGPICHYASTVEVAYPFQPLPDTPEGSLSPMLRVIIPEPCLWEPETPYYYHGFLNVTEKQGPPARVPVSHGLRSLALGVAALRLNTRPFRVRGTRQLPQSADETGSLRQNGVNTLLVPVTATNQGRWAEADRLGFFVLGELDGQESTLYQALKMRGHASCLGWLLPPDCAHSIAAAGSPLKRLATFGSSLIGVRLERVPVKPLAPWVDFVACDTRLGLDLTGLPLPKLLVGEEPSALAMAGTFGSIS